ncbi:hypothetical protein HDV06_004603 [Boothiomyces sp. JEL0866]|nr:hypothetical protein HDV06_004603 [Boothiomyces sp. JEL0866]
MKISKNGFQPNWTEQYDSEKDLLYCSNCELSFFKSTFTKGYPIKGKMSIKDIQAHNLDSQHCLATEKIENPKKRVLIGVTGSVATIKIYNLIRDLKQVYDDDIELKIITTKSALTFFNPKEIEEEILYDEDEWKEYKRGDPVLHIELRNWADLLLIAPIDANTIGKAANGLCDNLLTCVLRAWDIKSGKKVVFCPAMNTAMWDHPITNTQLENIKKWGYLEIVDPIPKLLACGDLGNGAMAETGEIAKYVKSIL